MPYGVDQGRLHIDDQRTTRRKKPHTGKPGITEREQAANVLRAGDRLLVACPAVIGNSADDVMKVLGWVERKGATVFDVEFEREICGITDSMDYAKHAERQLAQMRTEPARRALKASGKKTGPKKGPLKIPLKDLLDMWQQPEVYTVEYIAEQAGLKRRATYLLFEGIPRGKPVSEAA